MVEFTRRRCLFIGDSITRSGGWAKRFPHWNSCVVALDGFTTGGLSRLSYPLLALYRWRLVPKQKRPDVVSVLIGTNDLGKRRDVAATAESVAALLRRIRTSLPEAKIVVSSVLPRQHEYAGAINSLNDRLRRSAPELEALFLDLWPVFDNGMGCIRPEVSSDGLHLNEAGYQLWAELLRNAIDS